MQSISTMYSSLAPKRTISSKSRYNTIPQVPSIQDYLKEHFYLLAVLGEEDEYRTTKWRKFHLGSHNLIQTVYAHVHSDISLADVILGIFV